MSEIRSSTSSQTQRFLLLGFGGLLLLLAFTGLNALSVLRKIQTRNESIRQDYVNRDRILEQLRSDIYLSGTHVRDLLLEPDPTRADVHRKELDTARGRIESMLAEYRGMLRETSVPRSSSSRRKWWRILTPCALRCSGMRINVGC